LNARQRNRVLRCCGLVLRLASWFVPRAQRADWLREWSSEVWHWCHFLAESERLNTHSEQELLGHCWGAFPDALWHRFNRVAVLSFLRSYPLNSRFCTFAILAMLAGLLVASPTSLAFWIFTPPAFQDPSHLLNVSPAPKAAWLQPEVLRDLAERSAGSNPLIAAHESYAWRPSFVRGPAGGEGVLSARVTAGMFELLGVRPSLGRTFRTTDSSMCPNCVVLSNGLWRSQFRSDSNVMGRWLMLDGRQVEIIGVLPPQFRFPAHDIGLYTPFDLSTHRVLPMYEWAGVLLRVSPRADAANARREFELFVNRMDALPANTKLDVLSLKDLEYQSLESCAAIAAFAFLLLLALTWRTVVRLRTTAPRLRMVDVWRWWSFFAIKSFLLLVIVLIASLNLVQMAVARMGGSTHPYAGGAIMWLFVVGSMIALTWSIRDQLARCRTCLRRLKIQVDLGSAGAILCGPSGVELVCDGGHGMLHLPASEISYVDHECWTDLDDSWQGAMGRYESGISLL
jgi:MacB-like protein